MRNFSTRVLIALLLLSTLRTSFAYSESTSLEVFGTPSGVQKVIVIPVQFPDASGSASLQEPLDHLLMQLNQYYTEVSYRKVSLQSDVLRKWITLPKRIAFYGADASEHGDDAGGNSQGSWQMILDAIPLADPDVDFSKYESLIIMHAGNDQAKTSPRRLSSEIWSKTFWNQPSAVRTIDGVSIDKASIVSEFSLLGVWAHEFAHQIGFLPDLYDSKNLDHQFVGPWSLMDGGASLGKPPGSTPSHLESWSRIKLGWLSPATTIQREGEFTLNPLELPDGIRALQIPLNNGNYYLLELRRRIGFDSSLPEQGVLIYLVDETKGSGQGPVRVIDANNGTATLKDAPFSTGSAFADERNKVFISVLAAPGGAVRIRVSTNLTPTLSIQTPDTLPIFQYTIASVRVTPSIPNLLLEVYLDEKLYRSFDTSLNGTYLVPLFFDASKTGIHNLRASLIDRAQNVHIETSVQVRAEIPGYIWALIVAGILIAILSIVRRARRARPPSSSLPQPTGNDQGIGSSYSTRSFTPAFSKAFSLILQA